MKRPNLVFTTLTGFTLFAMSSAFLLYRFGGDINAATTYSKFPVQNELLIQTRCLDQSAIRPGLVLNRSKPILLVTFVIPEDNKNKDDCFGLTVNAQGFSFKNVRSYSGQSANPFDYVDKNDENALIIKDKTNDGYGINNFEFGLAQEYQAPRVFVAQIELTDFFSQIASDIWALDLKLILKADIGNLKSQAFAFTVEDKFNIETTNISPIVSLDDKEERVYRVFDLPKKSFANTEVSESRFSISLKDRSSKIWRDISIFLASTLFGASISVLIECFLSLELYRLFVKDK